MKDAEEKASQYYSQLSQSIQASTAKQSIQTSTEIPPKRRKSDELAATQNSQHIEESHISIKSQSQNNNNNSSSLSKKDDTKPSQAEDDQRNELLEILSGKSSVVSDDSDIQNVTDSTSPEKDTSPSKTTNERQRRKKASKSTSETEDSIFKKPELSRTRNESVKGRPRSFPGPAGLLTGSFQEAIRSKGKAKQIAVKLIQADCDESATTEICSQNTENKFLEGAWQCMVNDLPSDFLKGCDIATIVEAKMKRNSGLVKIPFIAGIIDQIDTYVDNPSIVLKDLTGSIGGLVQVDVLRIHQNNFKREAVILLHNAGVAFKMHYIKKTCHLLISPENVLAIYGKNGPAFQSSHMQTIIEDYSQNSSPEYDFEQETSSYQTDKSVSSNRNFDPRATSTQKDENVSSCSETRYLLVQVILNYFIISPKY